MLSWFLSDVTTEIVTAVLARHIKGCNIDVQGLEVEQLIEGDGGATAQAVLDKLTPVLNGFENLPLKIAGMSAVHCSGSSGQQQPRV